MDYAPMKGCMVIRPYGYSIWERIKEGLDRRFKETGHQNAYFPLFIPKSFLEKEAEHVEGFAPEVAWVTRGGQEDLAEPYAIRPTSEAIVCSMYSKWIQSWRDLPVLINQWCNIVRWEKATRPFVRTTEFLWQEGHTAHASHDEAEAEALRMLEVYREFIEDELSVPLIAGLKTDAEKFAGALRTYTVEALMTDGRALQAGTSHNLGQGFAKAFDITFLDRDGSLEHVWQTSWGVTTRLIGVLIMVHGDDRGLVLPPRVAPIQVVIVPIAAKRRGEEVLGRARELAHALSGVARTRLDDRPEYTPGWKFNDWEMRGVPLRVELGPRDLERGRAVVVRRDTGEKLEVAQDALPERVARLLDDVQSSLFARAQRYFHSATRFVDGMDDLKRTLAEKRGMVVAGWCGDPGCETAIKEETGATVRCLPLVDGGAGAKEARGVRPGAGAGLHPDFRPAERCARCGGPAAFTAYLARAY